MTNSIRTAPDHRQTLSALFVQVQDQSNRSVDYLASTDQLQQRTIETAQGKTSQIILEQTHGAPTMVLNQNTVAFDQIAQRANIDVRTARRLQSNYSVEYDALVNAIWQKETCVRMIRTFDAAGDELATARAFVSNQFKTFDNSNLLAATLPQLMESDAEWKVWSADVTEKRMHVRLVSERIQGLATGPNDLVKLGFDLTNSETGHGSVAAIQKLVTWACLNGQTFGKLLRSSHVTSARDDAGVWSQLTDEAKNADNLALELKVRDVVATAANQESFDVALAQFRAAGDDLIEGTGQAAVDQLGAVLRLTKSETSNVMEGLIQTMTQSGYAGKAVSRATLVNAVTAVAHVASADDVDRWHDRGSEVLNLSPSKWSSIALAA